MEGGEGKHHRCPPLPPAHPSAQVSKMVGGLRISDGDSGSSSGNRQGKTRRDPDGSDIESSNPDRLWACFLGRGAAGLQRAPSPHGAGGGGRDALSLE